MADLLGDHTVAEDTLDMGHIQEQMAALEAVP